MNPLSLVKFGVVALLVTIAFVTLQAWKSDLRAKGRAEVQAKWDASTAMANENARELERMNFKSKENALENQKKELARTAAIDERIHVVTVSVRDEAAAAVNAARADPAACPDTAATLGELFAECRAGYEAMGRAAQGHATDVKALMESWPQCQK
jgi:hypothetical protein